MAAGKFIDAMRSVGASYVTPLAHVLQAHLGAMHTTGSSQCLPVEAPADASLPGNSSYPSAAAMTFSPMQACEFRWPAPWALSTVPLTPALLVTALSSLQMSSLQVAAGKFCMQLWLVPALWQRILCSSVMPACA